VRILSVETSRQVKWCTQELADWINFREWDMVRHHLSVSDGLWIPRAKRGGYPVAGMDYLTMSMVVGILPDRKYRSSNIIVVC